MMRTNRNDKGDGDGSGGGSGLYPVPRTVQLFAVLSTPGPLSTYVYYRWFVH